MDGKSAAGRARSTTTRRSPSALSPMAVGSAAVPARISGTPFTSARSDASGDSEPGVTSRRHDRTTSAATSGVPSENSNPSRSWNTTRRPPSSTVHDSASAGRSVRLASNTVSVSNSWATMAALAASPCRAGSIDDGWLARIVAEPVLAEPAAMGRSVDGRTPGRRGTTSAATTSRARTAMTIRRTREGGTGSPPGSSGIRSAATSPGPGSPGVRSPRGARARPARGSAGAPSRHSRTRRIRPAGR